MNNKDQKLHNEAQQSKESNEHNIDEAAMNFNADDSLAGTTHLNDEMASEEDDKIQELEAQVKEANDKYLRLVAEFDNLDVQLPGCVAGPSGSYSEQDWLHFRLPGWGC